MGLLAELLERSPRPEEPFLLSRAGSLSLADLAATRKEDLSAAHPGDVVALVGGFDPWSIYTLLALLDMGCIVVPLTADNAAQHDYFFDAAKVDVVVSQEGSERLREMPSPEPLLEALRRRGEAGLVLFSSGTTGLPKAILHGAERFLVRYRTPRPAMRTLSFLLFDHIGGLNTLFHMLFNNGQVVMPAARTVEQIAADINDFAVELLPATPTFLRLLLLSGELDRLTASALRLVTYGTERMDQPTLDALCAALPQIDFRQTYGMSELGILRIKTRDRNSLWIQVGGEGVEWQAREGLLHIKAENRMCGYLNAVSPFAADGWYCTRDMVEVDGPWLRIIGRQGDLINVGGLKVLPEEVERAALQFPGILLAKASGAPNPLTGMHVELVCQIASGAAAPEGSWGVALKRHLRRSLPSHAVPQRIRIEDVAVSHRFKKI